MPAMDSRFWNALRWLFGPGPSSDRAYLDSRWLFLRALGIIYFSAFYSLHFQIRGLIGSAGILPVGEYLESVSRYMGGWARFWYAPTLFWIRSSDTALMVVVWVGIIASIALILNLWPRVMLFICFVCFLSFIGAAQDFASYQSDGMLLEAGFIALFFAPGGIRPGRGAAHPPSRVTHFLLLWEWFRIYFESGVAKLTSGDPQWRHLTAMDQYYQNGPLPTWIGWYVQHLPHSFHVATAGATLFLELILVWMMFLPRRLRVICFCIVTPWEIGIILTANYTFLNYLVLALGILLLDDRSLEPLRRLIFRRKCGHSLGEPAAVPASAVSSAAAEVAPITGDSPSGLPSPAATPTIPPVLFAAPPSGSAGAPVQQSARWLTTLQSFRLLFVGVVLSFIFYCSTVQLVQMLWPSVPLPTTPVRLLEPFRIADRYGLFAVMTLGRYEIEFQGSNDGGHTWLAYGFRNKPQATNEPPRIYAPYQPRFDWNLWFASLGNWRESPIVLLTEERILEGSPPVMALFESDPFPLGPPLRVRAVIWQYWFTDMATKRATGEWWRRQMLGLYAPSLEREPDGRIAVVEMPTPPMGRENPPENDQ